MMSTSVTVYVGSFLLCMYNWPWNNLKTGFEKLTWEMSYFSFALILAYASPAFGREILHSKFLLAHFLFSRYLNKFTHSLIFPEKGNMRFH